MLRVLRTLLPQQTAVPPDFGERGHRSGAGPVACAIRSTVGPQLVGTHQAARHDPTEGPVLLAALGIPLFATTTSRPCRAISKAFTCSARSRRYTTGSAPLTSSRCCRHRPVPRRRSRPSQQWRSTGLAAPATTPVRRIGQRLSRIASPHPFSPPDIAPQKGGNET